MSRKYKEDIKFSMLKLAAKNMEDGKEMKNHNTKRTYARGIEAFSDWAKAQGLNRLEKIENAGVAEVIQQYEKSLEANYTPATIHTKLAPVCLALGVNMKEVKKPKRTIGTIVRGRRQEGEAKDGDRQMNDPRFARIVAFQEGAGIRRAELARLTGKDLVRDESGYLCVLVTKGKGGKRQEQRVGPAYEATVQLVFENVGADENVFSSSELNNKINFHGLRQRSAKENYNYYLQKIQNNPQEYKKLFEEVVARWDRAHGYSFENRKLTEARKRFIGEILGHGRTYTVRGESAVIAKANGLPLSYDRLALMAVSVFHLSHWRLGVTVTNYMLAVGY